MKISKYQNTTRFNGKIYFLSEGSNNIRNAVLNNSAVKNIASGEADLYVKIPFRHASKGEMMAGKDYEQYKLIFILAKPANTIIQKIINCFRKKTYSVSKNYHSEDSVIRLLNERSENIMETLCKGEVN